MIIFGKPASDELLAVLSGLKTLCLVISAPSTMYVWQQGSKYQTINYKW